MKGHARPDAGAPTPGTRRLGRFLALGSLLLVSGCVAQGSSFMSPEGPIAALQKYHLIQVTIISLVVVLPVIVLVPWLAWHYRASNKKATYRPEWDMNHALEWVMWGVPVLIVIVLGWYLWIYTHKLDPYKPIASTEKATQVQVVGLDWKWMFIYPDYHIATVGEMAFPDDRPVALSLTSDTVMQSFLISALGGQIYTMPGMDAKLHLSAHSTGSYLGMNTQYSGDGMDQMTFTAKSMSKDDFDKWVSMVQNKGIALNNAAYNIVAKRSTPTELRHELGTKDMPSTVVYFNDVPSGFYGDVLHRYHSGEPVPAEKQPGAVFYGGKAMGE